MKVLETLQFQDDTVGLVIPVFPDEVITDRIKTNLGVFGKDRFVVSSPSHCFSEPRTRIIAVKGVKEEIVEIDFI